MKLKQKLTIPTLIGIFFILTIFPSTAYAHSEFASSNPTNGSVLKASPKTIELKFSDKITLSADALQLVDSKSKIIKTKKPKLSSSNVSFSVDIPKLKDGNYIALYSVVSGDTHVIKGAISFSVGDETKANQSTNQNQIAKLLAEKKIPKSVEYSKNISRFFIFLSVSLICSLVIFRAYFPGIKNNVRLKYIFNISIIMCALASFLNLGFKADEVGSFRLLKAFNPIEIGQEINTNIGRVYAFRILICALIYIFWRLKTKAINRTILVSLVGLLVLSIALTGHATTGEYQKLAFIFDLVHVVGASFWLGGLIIIPFLRNDKNYKEIVSKFSKCVIYAVIAILISGVFATWRQAGTLQAVKETFYGNLVLSKLAIYLVLIIIAFFSRAFVKRLFLVKTEDETTKNKLTKLIYIESLLLVLVLSLSSVLVETVPAKVAINASITKQVVTKKSIVEVNVESTKFGFNTVHVYVLDRNGSPLRVGEGINTLQESIIDATWSNKDKNIENLPVTMRFLGLNHFSSTKSYIPAPGKWTLSINVKIDEFTSVSIKTDIVFR